MQKNKIGYILALFMLSSTNLFAQNSQSDTNSFSYFQNRTIYEPDKFAFSEIHNFLNNQEKEQKIKNISYYISARYNLNEDKVDNIVRVSFEESEKHDIDPLLILSIVGVESMYDRFAKSKKGAIGLTQVMPRYHKSKISEIKKQDLDLFSVKGNITVGIKVIKEYLGLANGNVPKALQMYNGSTSDKKQRYSKKVLKKRKSLYDAFNL